MLTRSISLCLVLLTAAAATPAAHAETTVVPAVEFTAERPRVTGDRIVLSGDIVFEGRRLRARGRSLISKVALHAFLASGWKRIRVEAHTDPHGEPRRKLALSQYQAAAVRAALLREGLDPQRIHAIGYGGAMALDRNATAAADRKNRRIEIVIER